MGSAKGQAGLQRGWVQHFTRAWPGPSESGQARQKRGGRWRAGGLGRREGKGQGLWLPHLCRHCLGPRRPPVPQPSSQPPQASGDTRSVRPGRWSEGQGLFAQPLPPAQAPQATPVGPRLTAEWAAGHRGRARACERACTRGRPPCAHVCVCGCVSGVRSYVSSACVRLSRVKGQRQETPGTLGNAPEVRGQGGPGQGDLGGEGVARGGGAVWSGEGGRSRGTWRSGQRQKRCLGPGSSWRPAASAPCS